MLALERKSLDIFFMEIPYILRQIGFSDKDVRVYLALLANGTCSVRRLSKETELSKYSVNESLKSLRDSGLVSVFQKHKKQSFSADDPIKLVDVINRREKEMSMLKSRVDEVLPELKSIYTHGGNRPAVKYYEGKKGLEIILKDVLSQISAQPGHRSYRVFSSSRFRQFLFDNFPGFTKERIAKNISVKILTMGEERPCRPLMEQRTIPAKNVSPTYTFIYGSRVAFLSLKDDDNPTGFIVDDDQIADSQRIIFDQIWNSSTYNRRMSVKATIEEHL